jgi:hypothetical protein
MINKILLVLNDYNNAFILLFKLIKQLKIYLYKFKHSKYEQIEHLDNNLFNHIDAVIIDNISEKSNVEKIINEFIGDKKIYVFSKLDFNITNINCKIINNTEINKIVNYIKNGNYEDFDVFKIQIKTSDDKIKLVKNDDAVICNKKLINHNNINIQRYFDMIYIINLSKNKDYKNKCINYLRCLNITNYYIFDACNAKEYIYEYLYNYSSKEINEEFKKYCFTPGSIGCFLSHIFCVINAKKNNYKKILILEDDFIPHYNFHEKFFKSSSNSWPSFSQSKRTQYVCSISFMEQFYVNRHHRHNIFVLF